MKFLVTGGGGYIGLHIGLNLLKRNHQVILFDIRKPAFGPPVLFNEEDITWISRCEVFEKEINFKDGKIFFIEGTIMAL